MLQRVAEGLKPGSSGRSSGRGGRLRFGPAPHRLAPHRTGRGFAAATPASASTKARTRSQPPCMWVIRIAASASPSRPAAPRASARAPASRPASLPLIGAGVADTPHAGEQCLVDAGEHRIACRLPTMARWMAWLVSKYGRRRPCWKAACICSVQLAKSGRCSSPTRARRHGGRPPPPVSPVASNTCLASSGAMIPDDGALPGARPRPAPRRPTPSQRLAHRGSQRRPVRRRLRARG